MFGVRPGSLRTAAVAIALSAGVLIGAPSFVAAQTSQDSTPAVAQGSIVYPVAIHAGTCAQTQTEPQYTLTDLAPRLSNQMSGTAPGPAVLESESTVEANFDNLLGAQGQSYALALHRSKDDFGTLVACADLGGPIKDGTLVVGLRPLNDSGLSGVAMVEKQDDGNAKVTVFAVIAATTDANATPMATPRAGAATPVASPMGSPAASPIATPAAQAGGTQSVIMVDAGCESAQLTAVAGQDAVVTLPNASGSEQAFVIDQLGINVTVQAGQTGSVTINAPAGQYQFSCGAPGQQGGTVGTLTVQ